MSNSPRNQGSVEETVTLDRAVGPEEPCLIREAGNLAFPPRLAGQPIFYPVLNKEYAVQIARDWNAKDVTQKGCRDPIPRTRESSFSI